MKNDMILDCFGQEMTSLKEKKLFLFDMDGTIYNEELVFEGVLELLGMINDIGGRYVFITNNSSKSVEDYIKKVNKMGIEAAEENFFTSTQATIMYLKKRYPGKKVYCQGTRAFCQELRKNGIFVIGESDVDAELVLVGFDTEMNSEKIRKTCQILQTKDIPYVATNPDLRCPVNFGFIPDCGAICNMIESATDKKPVYVGKPQPVMVDCVREKWGYEAMETVIIGDRLYTDIATGINAGITTICVLTGESSINDIVKSDIKPTFTLNSVNDLRRTLEYLLMG